jgi:hypothetical protein
VTTRAEQSIRPRVRELPEHFPQLLGQEVDLQARARLASPVEAPQAPHRSPALPAGAVVLRVALQPVAASPELALQAPELEWLQPVAALVAQPVRRP